MDKKRKFEESNLRFLSRDGCISVDELCEHSTESFNTKGQRSNIKEEYIGNIASQYTTFTE